MAVQELNAITAAHKSASKADVARANKVMILVMIAFSLITVGGPVVIHNFTGEKNSVIMGVVLTSITWGIATLLGIVTMKPIGKVLDPHYIGWKAASRTKGFHKNAILAGTLTAIFASVSTAFVQSVSPVIAAGLSSLIVLFVVDHDFKTGAIPQAKKKPVIALLIISVIAAAGIELGTNLEISLLALPILGLVVNYIRSHAEVYEQKGACLVPGISVPFAFARVMYSALASTVIALVIGVFDKGVFALYADLTNINTLTGVVLFALCFKIADYGRIFAKAKYSVVMGLIMLSASAVLILILNYPAFLIWGKIIPGTEGLPILVWIVRTAGVLVLGACIWGIYSIHNAAKSKEIAESHVEG